VSDITPSNTSIKVAVIDSGIDVNNIDIKDNIVGGISFEDDHSEDYHDENGHGTLCAAVVKSQYPAAGIYAVKVLNHDAGGTHRSLLNGLKHMLGSDIRLINLSIAIFNDDYAQQINEICQALYNEGKIIVCSIANGSDKSSPAQFANVIGVAGKMFKTPEEYWYNSRYDIQCIADMTRMLTSDLKGTYRLWGKCNSKATALLTGKIAGIMAEKPDISFEELEEILEEKAARTEWDSISLQEDELPNESFNKEKYTTNSGIVQQITSIFKETYRLSEDISDLLQANHLFHPSIGVDPSNCYEVIQRIETTFGLKFDYRYISSATFASINTLSDLVIDRS